jgi:3-deoxy-7-phosphoheptulonate synthase
LAAAAVKADGIIVEVHTDPDQSVSDAAQAICPDRFAAMMYALDGITKAVGMRLQADSK